jgi:hypothetical protein
VKNQDPLALAVFAAALALLAGLVLYVIFGASRAPQGEPASAAPQREPASAGSAFFERLKRELRGMAEEVRRDLPGGGNPPPAAKSAATSEARPAQAVARVPVEPGHVWRYAVQVQPPAWRDAMLSYQTRKEGGGVGVHTEFTHSAGKMNFNLGSFAPGHASHANTRFPGFFMHASYFPASLAPGQQFSWSWPWQGAGAGRIKRYDARVLRWEDVQVPAGTYRALLIEVDLSYIEGGKVKARARETLWYAPAAAQLVRVVRDGRTPDEGLERIVAELAEYR